MIANQGRRAGEGCEVEDVALGADEQHYIGAAARESAGRRGTGDIEPNASNKANIMELMTGCVPLTLVTRARLQLLRVQFLSVKRREK